MLQVNPALAVPEPATWALLLVALLTLGAATRTPVQRMKSDASAWK